MREILQMCAQGLFFLEEAPPPPPRACLAQKRASQVQNNFTATLYTQQHKSLTGGGAGL